MKKPLHLIALAFLLTGSLFLAFSCSKDDDPDNENTGCSISESLAGTTWIGRESRSEEKFVFDDSHYIWKVRTVDNTWVEDEKGTYCFDGTNGKLNRKSSDIRFTIDGNVLTLSMEDQASEDPFIKAE